MFIHFILKSLNFAAPIAHVVKLVDTSDLGSDAARCGGSSPSMRTFLKIVKTILFVWWNKY